MFRTEEDNDENEIEREEEIVEVTRESDIVPKASSVQVKEIARRPVMVRAIFYLKDHGVCCHTEIERAIGCNTATVHFAMKKLSGIGVVQTLKQSEVENPIDKRMTYYKLAGVKQRPEFWNQFLSQLEKLFEYELLNQLKPLLPEHEWISIEQLKKDPKINHIITRRFGMTFEKALKILLSFPVFYTQNDNGEVSAIKRKYDSKGRRIDEQELEPKIEEVSKTKEPETVEFPVPEEIV